jgi:hypothetical protein
MRSIYQTAHLFLTDALSRRFRNVRSDVPSLRHSLRPAAKDAAGFAVWSVLASPGKLYGSIRQTQTFISILLALRCSSTFLRIFGFRNADFREFFLVAGPVL